MVKFLIATAVSVFWVSFTLFLIVADSFLDSSGRTAADLLLIPLYLYLFATAVYSGKLLYKYWDGTSRQDAFVRVAAMLLPIMPAAILGPLFAILHFLRNLL